MKTNFTNEEMSTIKKKKRKTLISIVGLFGSALWVLTIYMRGTDYVQISVINFLLGILPNFGVGLLLPMITILFYPVLFEEEISVTKYRYVLVAFFLLLFISEIIHDKFINSPFDIYDLAASFIALGIMAFLYNES